jgi:hypothetical protein
MANLIQNNSKLVKLTENQIYQSQTMQINKTDNSGDVDRHPKTIRITKDQSGFGFNVRGQISGKFRLLNTARLLERENPFMQKVVIAHDITYPKTTKQYFLKFSYINIL